jgi:hypothetical protein
MKRITLGRTFNAKERDGRRRRRRRRRRVRGMIGGRVNEERGGEVAGERWGFE